MSKPKRDRTTGLPLPSPVIPLTSICLSIEVPNALEYRSALKGVLSELGKSWTWSQTAGEDNQGAYDAAELWRSRIANAVYQLDCGDGMSCDDVANCIETNEAVRTAIGAIVPSVPIDGLVFPPGTPLTPSQMSLRLNEIDECAFDPYWAQVEQYVDYMVNLGQDVLEMIAAYSAALDAGENVPMGQFLGKLKNASNAGAVLNFLQWVLTVVKAQYESADTAENRVLIKCAIFCEHRDDCLITIEGTLNTLNERLGGILVPSDLSDLPTMVSAFTTAVFDPALALDLWILFLMGSAKTAGMFGLQGINETLQLVLAVAVNDANNDWETLCEDCPDPNYIAYDFTISEQGWQDLDFGSTWSSAGWSRNIYDTWSICIPNAPFVVTEIWVTFANDDIGVLYATSNPDYTDQSRGNFPEGENPRKRVQLIPFSAGERVGITGTDATEGSDTITKIEFFG